MIAYCGIDCSKCESYLASRSGSGEELAQIADRMAKLYNTEVRPEDVVCDGCKEGERHFYFCSNMCAMRKCCAGKRYETCIECGDFPCTDLQAVLDHVPDARNNLEKLRKR